MGFDSRREYVLNPKIFVDGFVSDCCEDIGLKIFHKE